MARQRYTSKLKAKVVLEVVAGDKTPGQIAEVYGVHPNSVGLWKRRLELPRYDGHLSLWANQGGVSWREAEDGIRPSTRSRLSSL